VVVWWPGGGGVVVWYSLNYFNILTGSYYQPQKSPLIAGLYILLFYFNGQC